MAKKTAFDEYFEEAVTFSEGYGDCISALKYKTEEEALAYFREYHGMENGDYGHPEAISVDINWVHYHGGRMDDEEFINCWWITPENEGKKGAKPVWECSVDWHMYHYGHTFIHKDPKDYYNFSKCVKCGETLV